MKDKYCRTVIFIGSAVIQNCPWINVCKKDVHDLNVVNLTLKYLRTESICSVLISYFICPPNFANALALVHKLDVVISSLEMASCLY